MIDISVILFYNREREWLREARSSYYWQHFTGESELIEINKDQSTSKNLNDGLKLAKGKYVKYLCDDDMLLPNCLQTLFNAAEETEADVVCSGALNFNELTKEITKYQSNVPETIQQLAEVNTIHGGSTLFRLSAVKAVGGFNEGLQYGEEYDLYLKLAANGYSFTEVYDFVYFYRMHKEMKSMQVDFTDGEAYIQRKRIILHEIQQKYQLSHRIKKVNYQVNLF
jgi:glycosyltransferase involved in cell wall biosynthesis